MFKLQLGWQLFSFIQKEMSDKVFLLWEALCGSFGVRVSLQEDGNLAGKSLFNRVGKKRIFS